MLRPRWEGDYFLFLILSKMAGIVVISFVVVFIYACFRKMSTALKKNSSSLMKLCHAEIWKYRPKSGTRQLQVSGQADAECSPGTIS